ncbi:protein piccolo isoform X2 [Stigmatopora argus]
MGNEASLEGGGQGPLQGLPEGLAPDGAGGFVRLPDGVPVDPAELSEEQRTQLAAAMSRAQGRQPGGSAVARRPSESGVQQPPRQPGAPRGPAGLSKSRTVDAFNQSTPGKVAAGRSPSSFNLFESRFRQEPKDSESKSSSMFGSSFLSGANPLSAMSSMTSSVSSSITSMGDSVNIPKFGLFGEEDEGASADSSRGGKPPAKSPQQGSSPKTPQKGETQKQTPGPPGQLPKPGQGQASPGLKSAQGPPGQAPRQGQGQQGPKQGQGPPSQQSLRQGQGPPAQQGPKPGQGPGGQQVLRQGQGPPGQQPPKQAQGPSGQGAKQTQSGPPQQKEATKPGTKPQGPPGPPAESQQCPTKSTCPLCKTTQLNIGSKDPPNYSNCTECKNQVCSLCGFSPPDSAGKEWLCLNCQMQRAMGAMDPPGVTKPKQGSGPPSPQRQASGKPGKLLIKQQSTSDQGLTPPTTPRQKSPGAGSPGPPSPGSPLVGSHKIDPKTGRPIQQKASPQQSPAKAKQESGFFGGLGSISFGGLTDSAKPAAASSPESVTGKLFGGLGGLMDSTKPQQQAKQEESVAGKLFGGFGGITEAAKPPAGASQMFSFGSSLLNSATSLVTGEEDKPDKSPPESPADSGPGSPPDSPFSEPGSPPDSDSAPDTPPAKSRKAAKIDSIKGEPSLDLASKSKESCPLCHSELNVGTSEAPNYNLCTDCKKSVCNLCGFNPAPHLGENEWLCLNCQTKRASHLDGTPSPEKPPPAAVPAPSSAPAPAAVDSEPIVVEAAATDKTPPALDSKVEVPPTPTSNEHDKPHAVGVSDQSLAAELESEPVIHCQDSESAGDQVAEIQEHPQKSPTDATQEIPEIDQLEKSSTDDTNLVKITPQDENQEQGGTTCNAIEAEPMTSDEVVKNLSEVQSPDVGFDQMPIKLAKDRNHAVTESANPMTEKERNSLEPASVREERISQLDSGSESPATEGLVSEPVDLKEEPIQIVKQTEDTLKNTNPLKTEAESAETEKHLILNNGLKTELKPEELLVRDNALKPEAESAETEPKTDLIGDNAPKTEAESAETEPKTEEPLVGDTALKTKAESAETEPKTDLIGDNAPKTEAESAKTEPKTEEPLVGDTALKTKVESAETEPKTDLIGDNAPKTEAESAETDPKTEEPLAGDTALKTKAESAETEPKTDLIGDDAPKREAESAVTEPKTEQLLVGDIAPKTEAESAETEPKTDLIGDNAPKTEAECAVTEPKTEQLLVGDIAPKTEAESAETEPKTDLIGDNAPKSEAESAVTGPKTEQLLVGDIALKTEAESAEIEPKTEELLTAPQTSAIEHATPPSTQATKLDKTENEIESNVSKCVEPSVTSLLNPPNSSFEPKSQSDLSEDKLLEKLREASIQPEPEPTKTQEQKPLDEKTVPSEHSLIKTENICAIDQNEKTLDDCHSVVTPQQRDTGTNDEAPLIDESLVQAASSLVNLPETQKSRVETESTIPREEQSPLSGVLSKEQDFDKTAVPDSDSREKVITKESFESKTHVSNDTLEDCVIPDDKESCSHLLSSQEQPGNNIAEKNDSIGETEANKSCDVPSPDSGNMQQPISLSEVSLVGVNDGTADIDAETKSTSQEDIQSDLENAKLSVASAPVVEAQFPASVVCEHNASINKDANLTVKKEAPPEPHDMQCDEDTKPEEKKLETLKEPGDRDSVPKDGSPTSPSDLAKLENTVLPILEAKTKGDEEDDQKLTGSLKTRRKLEVLPLSPDSQCSDDDKDVGKSHSNKKLLIPLGVRGDSLDDSSESFGKESPMSGDDEDFIRKQIIEMSENEDASPSDEENLIRQKIRRDEKKRMERSKTESVANRASEKALRLTKEKSISPNDDEDNELQSSLGSAQMVKVDPPDLIEAERQSVAVRKFPNMELDTSGSPACVTHVDIEAEMESLTDSPDDRSKGEGSSSLHASSFTPGTSPTSLSSLDEDSDSSSPGHVRSSESKQHRKAKHRQPGQTLPTIEDSSEEEEMREEEELLKEQEKQRGVGKKSKREKEEVRGQRRRDRSMTPPSNLSPIEDASPTEELRQEAEMEEIRRSSCSDFSPSIDSDPEGFEIHAAKIAAVQKRYQLPTSVSLISPTEDKNVENAQRKPLRSADEAYEEIILRAKSPTVENADFEPGKETIYGGMLIEDYAYASVVDNSTDDLAEREKICIPSQPKKLRSPDEVYEDMIKKRKEFMKLEQEYQKMQTKNQSANPEIVLQPAENTHSNVTTVCLGKDGKPLLDAESAYEELMKKVLTPGTSPTLHEQEGEMTSSPRALHPIPDLKVTQCSSGELSSDEESIIKKEEETAKSESTSAVETPSRPSSSSDQQQDSPITPSQSDTEDLSSPIPTMSAPVTTHFTVLPTLPQYAHVTSSIVSTAPPIPPKPNVLLRANSQDKADAPVEPPLPPATSQKPTVFPRKPPVPLPPQAFTAPVRPETVTTTSFSKQSGSPTSKPHVPPPVPPKPSIPAGICESHRQGPGVKPPIAPKPSSGPSSPAHTSHPLRPTVLPTGSTEMALNLSPSTERKPFQSSTKSPTSPRYSRNLRDTYVVITLPSQPSSPVESLVTQAPSDDDTASTAQHAQPLSYRHTQSAAPPPTTRVPLAYTRVTESIENQEICSPEKHVSSSCHIIKAVSASAEAPVVMPNLISQVVTTEVQRTTVSVVHERTPPPAPAPRANGLPISLEKPMTQFPVQNGQTVLPCEVVDLRTMKADARSDVKGVDLSAGPDTRRQSFGADVSRQSSAVLSPVINLSSESTTVSILTDSITIVTCSATIQRCNSLESSQASSTPLQLTKNKAFEPVSQIVYRTLDSQFPNHSGEIPINLTVGASTVGGTFQMPPVTMAPSAVTSCLANGLMTSTTSVAGAVDLSTTKPFNTLVSIDTISTEVITAVVTEDDSKPVDLTAGKRAVCCDVVYKLPFAGSCTSQQPTTPLPEDRFGYRDDHYQYDRSPYGARGFGGIKPSMSDTNLAEAGLFIYKSKNSYNFSGTTDGAVDLSSAKISDAGEAVDYSKKGTYAGMAIPPFSQARVTSGTGTLPGTNSVLRSSNGVVYSSVAAPIPSTYAITTQPGSIFCTSFNTQSSMHTSDTMPSLSDIQNLPLTRSHSFLSTVSITKTGEQDDIPLNLEISKEDTSVNAVTTATTSLSLDYTDESLEAIAASLEALSSPMVPGDGQYQAERERLEMEKLKQQRLAEELEWERHEIQRFREQEQLLVQKELEDLQVMKQQILSQQEEERQAHLMLQKETYAQQQEQLEQIQRLQEQLRMQLEEQKLRQMYPPGETIGNGIQEAIVLGPDGTVLSRKITDSGCQTDEEDETVSKTYTAGRKKKSAKKSVDSCVQTDDEDQEEWEAQRSRQSRPRTARGERGGQEDLSLQAHSEISIQTDTDGNVRMETRMELSDSEKLSPKNRPTPLEIGLTPNLRADSSTLQAHPKSPNVLYSPLSPCISPSKSLEFVSYDKSLGDKSPQKLKGSPESGSPRVTKAMQRSMSDPKSMSPTGEERATGTQHGDIGKSSGGTPTGTQKKVKRTLPNPPSEDESSAASQTAHSTGSARRRMCRNSNMARAKILQDIDRELDLVERESSKLRKRQAELDEEEKEIDAKLRYLEMGINRRKDVLLKEREKRERAYLQGVAEDRDYMSDSEVSSIRETLDDRGEGDDEEIENHGLERPRTAPQSELDDFVPPQTKHEYGKYSQYQFSQSQYQQSLYQTPQSYHSHSMYSSVPSLTSSQQQSYQQMLLLQQKAARQAALLSELDTTKYDVISRQPDPTSSPYLGVKYDKYGNHLDLRALEVGGMAGSPMSTISDSYYSDIDHHTPRSYLLLEDAAELAKNSGLSSSYSLAERELAKAEKLLHRSAADLGSSDYLGSTSRLHAYGKTADEDDPMEEPYELKLLKQQLKQEFRRSTGGTESLDPLTGLSQHYYTPSCSLSSYSQRHYPKTDKYSMSRLTLEKQAAKQLPASVLYQKHKTPLLEPKVPSKYSSITESRGLDMDYTSYLGSTSSSPRSSRLMQDEITFGLRKNIAEQQKYLGSTLGANLAGSLNLGQSLGLDSAYPSGSRSRPSSRPTSCYGLDLSIKRDPSSSSLRLKGDGETSAEGSSFQTPSGRAKPTSLPIVQSGRGRIPIVAQNSEEESPLSPVGQPMGMARASAGPLPPISADTRDQFGSCLSLQDSQQQNIREEPSRSRAYVLMDDLQGTMSDSEAYHLRREETDWFDKPRDGRSENGHDKRQGKGAYYPFPHLRVRLQRDPKDRSVSGNGLGIRVVGGKEVPAANGEIGAYVAKVLPGGAAEQTGKILEGMQVLEWNGIPLTGKTYEEVQGLVGHSCNEAELCVRLDLNMLAGSEASERLDFQEPSKSDRPPRSPGVDPKQLAAELQKVSQQQAPSFTASSGSLTATTSATSSPAGPGSPSVGKKRHSGKTADGSKTPSHPITGDIQLQIHFDKQLGNLIVHVLQARNLAPRDNNGYSDPFVKVYLLPGRGQVMVVQNASAENKRKSKHAGKSLNPEWNQTVIYKNIHLEQLRKKTLEVSVWDYDKCSSNDFLGEVLIDLSNTAQLDNVPRWLPLKPQTEGEHHRRSHQGRHGSSKTSSQHSSPKTAHEQDAGKSSVIKSRSHSIFPDPAKGLPGRQRHSVVGVLTIQRGQPDWLPALPSRGNWSRSDGHPSTLRKAMSEERPHAARARAGYRSGDAPVTAASLDSGLSGSAYSLLDEDGETNEVDSAIFQVPRFGKIPNGTDGMKASIGDSDGKSQVMGEIKIALKKEVRTEGDHLVLEILQCRNITYKFKTADHLPDLYVKLYVVNIATQKRIIKKKTRVCRHDREPSFNETFRFCMNPAGHSLQLFLVSNGGKFVKKTLIGEAYVWLDKVDLRKRVVSWHKLLASAAQIHS